MLKEKIFNQIFYWLKIIIVAFVIAFLVRGFIFIPVTTTGNSMNDVIHNKDKVLMEKFTKIKRFDIVVVRLNENKIVLKRVIALAGEKIYYENGHLFIDNKELAEPYLKENLKKYHSQTYFTNDFTYNNQETGNKIPQEKYFVMGDNRPNSLDSRSFGVIDESQILGVAFMIYYPFDHMTIL